MIIVLIGLMDPPSFSVLNKFVYVGSLLNYFWWFQGIGLLIGMEDLAVDKQATFLSALLVPLCGQVCFGTC